jgi:hypothetical protein
VQVLCYADGYVPAAQDLQDMALLQDRFGVTLPPYLRDPHATRLESPGQPPNQRMHQPGHGRRLTPYWHGRSSHGRFSTRAAALQVMRGR